MKRVVVCCACWTLAVVMASFALAADQPGAKKGKKAKKAAAAATPAAFKLPKDISLTAEQQAKLDGVKTQYAAKLTDAQKKIADVYTAEQRTAQQAARKEAMAAGKKGKDLKGAVEASVKLTDEQRQKLSAAESEMKQLTKEIRKSVLDLLTVEQRQSLKGKGKK